VVVVSRKSTQQSPSKYHIYILVYYSTQCLFHRNVGQIIKTIIVDIKVPKKKIQNKTRSTTCATLLQS
jgi:hypothetical protein